MLGLQGSGALENFLSGFFKKQFSVSSDFDAEKEMDTQRSSDGIVVSCEEGVSSSLDVTTNSLLGKLKIFSLHFFLLLLCMI
jgi:hypothetical protein